MPSNRQVVSIVDFENLIGCAREILQLLYCPSVVLKIIDTELARIISEQFPDYELTSRITAFSFPPSSSGNTRDLERVARMAEAARQCGYTVLSVDREKDAADVAITALGLKLLEDRDVKAVVFCTNDSGNSQDPQSETSYVSFIKTVARRARLHLVGFHYIPRSFEGYPSSLLQESVAQRFREIEARRLNPRPRGEHLCYQS